MEPKGQKQEKRERRSKMRLSDVERIVEKVLPEHMPDKDGKKPHPSGERRGGTHKGHGKQG